MSTPEIWFKNGEALVSTHQHGTAEFGQGIELLKKSAQAGFLEAELTLGHVYVQVPSLPDAFQEAARWYQRAADKGHPMAQDRLADLYMMGRGVTQSDKEAFRWYSRTAGQGYALAQCNLAYMHTQGLGTPPDQDTATTLYLRAAAQGEGCAYFNLGLRYASGWGAPKNMVHASAWMQNAANLNYPTSKSELESIRSQLTATELNQAVELSNLIKANFTTLQQKLGQSPDGIGSAETYRQIVEDNFVSLGIKEFSLETSKRIRSRYQNDQGTPGPHRPGQPDTINAEPRIFKVPEFVSKTEAAHLMALSTLFMQSARNNTHDQLSNEQTAFTGCSATFHATFCDAMIRNLERRIASAFSVPAEHVEPISVLRYQRSDQYAPHVDYFDTARLEFNRRTGDKSGQRIASFLVYLLAPEAGGETHYLEIKQKVTGQSRMALCHHNLTAGGRTDPATLHTGEPVIKGEKWLARTTLREKPLY